MSERNRLYTSCGTDIVIQKQISLVRNFPYHVGDYNIELPEKECPNNYAEQCAFRAGWACAVEAINDELTKFRKANKLQ